MLEVILLAPLWWSGGVLWLRIRPWYERQMAR
jgi:hypothetical protein